MENAFLPVLRFCVCSDVHLESPGDEKEKRLRGYIRRCFEIAGADERYKNVDAFVFAGDSTNGGRKEQYDAFKTALDEEIGQRSRALVVIAKNHDNWEFGRDCIKTGLAYFKRISGQDTDFHLRINGFHFIGISTSGTDGEYYGNHQKLWLDEQLDAAVGEAPGKPVFVFQHEHVKNTVYGSSDFDGWGVSYLTDILEKYPQIVHFSGHSHYPLNDPRSVWQGEFTAVGTGAMSYAEFTVDDERCVHPENAEKIAQGWIVEADAKGNILLKGFDFLSGQELCRVSLGFDPRERKMKQISRSDKKAPVFPSGAGILTEKRADGIKVTFPAAIGSGPDCPVFLYRIKLLDSEGKTIEEKKLIHDYWYKNDIENYTAGFDVSEKTPCSIAVTAENAFGVKSGELIGLS